MARTALLNNVDHGDLRVAIAAGAQPGDEVNQMLVVPTEFEAAQRDHPILFRRDGDGTWQAVVLLGLDRDENLRLSEAGWDTSYRPAVQRRGPFVIGLEERTDGDGSHREPVIRVLLDDPRVGDTGEPLFLPQGGNAPYLDAVGAALRDLHVGVEVAPAMFAAFERTGLLRPVRLDIALDDATRYDVGDVWTIDADRLGSLDGDALAALHRDGFLALAFYAAASLGNIARLIAAKNARR